MRSSENHADGGSGDDVIYPDLHGDEVWGGTGDDTVFYGMRKPAATGCDPP